VLCDVVGPAADQRRDDQDHADCLKRRGVEVPPARLGARDEPADEDADGDCQAVPGKRERADFDRRVDADRYRRERAGHLGES
jgi:hypothetical protein